MSNDIGGWIKVHRKIKNWEWYTDANVFRVFFHILVSATHIDIKFRGIEIKRGQFLTKPSELGNDLKLTRQQVRTALKKLQSTNEITINVTNKYSMITVCKYDSYNENKNQDNQQNNQQDNQQKNMQPVNNQQNNQSSNQQYNQQNNTTNDRKSTSYRDLSQYTNQQNNQSSNQQKNANATVYVEQEEKKKRTNVVVVKKNEKKFEFEFSQISEWQSEFPRLNVVKKIHELAEKNSARNITAPKQFVYAALKNINQKLEKSLVKNIENEPSNYSNRNGKSTRNGNRRTQPSEFGTSQKFETALSQTPRTVPFCGEKDEVDENLLFT